MSGGWLVHRLYAQDPGRSSRALAWMLMYMPSASRWFDTYTAFGVEWAREAQVDGGTRNVADLVVEGGAKFRLNITKSPLKFLSFLTEYMGLRAGIKNRGVPKIDSFSYVLEFGAGVW